MGLKINRAMALLATFSAAHICAAEIQLTDDIKLDLGLGAYVRTHAISPGTGESQNGYTSRVQLKANVLLADGWSVNTRWQAHYDWSGDRRHSGGAGSNYTGTYNDGISLDVGYLQYTSGNTVLRAGRQDANWGYGFNIEDDRRDRVLAMQSYSFDNGNGMSLLGIYDLRFAESEYQAESQPQDYYTDLHMYALAAVGKYNQTEWGFLWAYFDGSNNNTGLESVAGNTQPQVGYGIDYFHNISPYFKTNLGDISLKGAVNIVLSDSTAKSGYHTTWGDNSIAGFLEGSYATSASVELQAQAVAFVDEIGRAHV